MADLDWLKKLEVGKGKHAFANKGFISTRNAPVAGYIIHYTQGATSLNGNLSYANKARVGADLYIAQDGSFHRAVPEGERIAHAGIVSRSKKRTVTRSDRQEIGIEMITDANGVPNHLQLKTLHAWITRDAQERGIDQGTLKDIVKAHGEVSPGHKKKWEGHAGAQLFRDHGAYGSSEVDYESFTRRQARHRPIMNTELHPVDRGLPSKTPYQKHLPSNWKPTPKAPEIKPPLPTKAPQAPEVPQDLPPLPEQAPQVPETPRETLPGTPQVPQELPEEPRLMPPQPQEALPPEMDEEDPEMTLPPEMSTTGGRETEAKLVNLNKPAVIPGADLEPPKPPGYVPPKNADLSKVITGPTWRPESYVAKQAADDFREKASQSPSGVPGVTLATPGSALYPKASPDWDTSDNVVLPSSSPPTMDYETNDVLYSPDVKMPEVPSQQMGGMPVTMPERSEDPNFGKWLDDAAQKEFRQWVADNPGQKSRGKFQEIRSRLASDNEAYGDALSAKRATVGRPTQSLDAGPQLSFGTQMRMSEQDFRKATAESATTALGFLGNELSTRNSYFNMIEDFARTVSGIRGEYDPDFFVPAEELSKYPEQYREYLQGSYNANDYLIRENEIQSRMKGEEVANEFYKDSGWFWPVYLSAGALTLFPIMAAGGAASSTAISLSGARTLGGMWAAGLAGEAPLVAGELYLGKKAGIYTAQDNLFIVGGTLLGGLAGAALLRRKMVKDGTLTPGEEAAANFRDQEKADDAFHKASEAAGKPVQEPPPEELIQKGVRPVIDPEKSAEVYRSPEGHQRASRDAEADLTLIARADQESTDGILRGVSEIFDRQKHVATSNVSGYIKVNDVDWEKVLQGDFSWLHGELVRLRRTAPEVVGENENVLKVRLKKGQEYLDLEKMADGAPGSFAMKGDNIAPPKKQKVRSMAIKAGDDDVLKSGKMGRDTKKRFNQAEAQSAGLSRQDGVRGYGKLRTRGGHAATPEQLSNFNAALSKHPKKAAEDPEFYQELIDELGLDELAELSSGGAMAAAPRDLPQFRKAYEEVDDLDRVMDAVERNQELLRGRDVPFLSRLLRGGRMSWFMSVGDRALMDENVLYRHFAQEALFDVGFDKTARDLKDPSLQSKGVTLDVEMDTYIKAMDGDLSRKAVASVNKYRQATENLGERRANMTNMAADQQIKNFMREVYDRREARRMGRDPGEATPGVAEFDAALDKHYSTILKHLNDPGLLKGEPRVWGPPILDEDGVQKLDDFGEPMYESLEGYRPVEGFGDNAYQEMSKVEGWMPRGWDGDAIARMTEKYGERILQDYLEAQFARPNGMWNQTYFDMRALRGYIKDAEDFELSQTKGPVGFRGKTKYDKMKEELRNADHASFDFLKFIEKHFDEVQQREIVEELARSKLTRAAKAAADMSRSIRKAVSGISDGRNLLQGNSVVNLVRNLLTEVDDLDDATREWAEDILSRSRRPSVGRNGRHSFHKAALDESLVIRKGGDEIRLRDFVQQDVYQSARGYLRKTGGRVVRGGLTYRTPWAGEGLDIKGIASDAEWESRVVKPVRAVEGHIRRRKGLFGGKTLDMSPEKDLEAFHRHLTGNVPPGSKALVFMQNMTYLQMLGNAGFAQATEVANHIGEGTMSHWMNTSHWKNLMQEARNLGKSPRDAKVTLGYLDQMGVGFDLPRGALGSQTDEHMGVGVGNFMGKFAQKGARLVFINSGLGGLQQSMQRDAAFGMTNLVYRWAAESGGDFSKLRGQDRQRLLRLMGNRADAEAILPLMYKHAKTDPGPGGLSKTVVDMDETARDFNGRLWHDFRQRVARHTSQVIQSNVYGNGHAAFQNQFVQILMTLKSFVYGSYGKQMLKNFREIAEGAKGVAGVGEVSKDLSKGESFRLMMRPASKLALQIVFGAATWVLINEIRMAAFTDEEAEAYREKHYTAANLGAAGITRSGALGLIPMLYNTPVNAAGLQEEMGFGVGDFRGSGLASTFTDPAVLNALSKFPALIGKGVDWIEDDFETSGQDVTKVTKTLTNLWQIQLIMGMAGDAIFND